MAPAGAEQLQRVVGLQRPAPVDVTATPSEEMLSRGQAQDRVLLGGDPDRNLRPGQRTLPGTYDYRGREVPDQPQPPAARASSETPRTLSQDEQRVIRQLQARDAEVRAHEAAHKSAGGRLSGPASYTYQQGPDGRNYAIGGEVAIRMPSSGSPESLARNAQQLRRAALAPAKPSSSDTAIAAMATRVEQQARADIRASQVEEAARLAEQRGVGATPSSPSGAKAEVSMAAQASGPGMSMPDGRAASVDAMAGRTFVARTDAEPLPPPRPRPPEPPPEPKAKEPPPPPKEAPPPPE